MMGKRKAHEIMGVNMHDLFNEMVTGVQRKHDWLNSIDQTNLNEDTKGLINRELERLNKILSNGKKNYEEYYND